MKLRLPGNRVLQARVLKTQWTYGVRSIAHRIDGGLRMHVLFVDCDNVKKRKFYSALRKAQSRFSLADIFVFRTGRGYHAIECGLHSRGEILDIHEYMSRSVQLEARYDWASIRRGFWVLRFGEKEGSVRPKYICRLMPINPTDKPISPVHAAYLKQIQGCTSIAVPKGDMKLPVIMYEAEINGRKHK